MKVPLNKKAASHVAAAFVEVAQEETVFRKFYTKIPVRITNRTASSSYRPSIFWHSLLTFTTKVWAVPFGNLIVSIDPTVGASIPLEEARLQILWMDGPSL